MNARRQGQAQEQAQTIEKIITDAKNGANIYPYNNLISDEVQKKIIDRLASMTLATLDLSNNSLRHRGVSDVIRILKNSSVVNLKLNSTDITCEGIKQITAQLTASSTLQTLSLRNNKIEDDSAKEIALALQSANVSLTCIDLSANFVKHEGACALANALASSGAHSCVTELYLDRNKIGCEGAKAIARTLALSHLLTLSLSFNDIEYEGTKEIAAALPNSSLRCLNLRCNDIGYEGIRELAAALPSSNLTTLSLRSCGVEHEGAKEIAAALSNSCLTTLNLRNNKIGDKGAKEIAAALSNSCLTTLNLRYNQIKGKGAIEIAAAIANASSSLTQLNMKYNSFGEAKTKIIVGLMRGTRITKFTIDCGSEIKKVIDVMVKENEENLAQDRFKRTKVASVI